MHSPVPSHRSTFDKLRRRLTNRNRSPLVGSFPSSSTTNPKSPLKPFLRSVGRDRANTRTRREVPIIPEPSAAPARQPDRGLRPGNPTGSPLPAAIHDRSHRPPHGGIPEPRPTVLSHCPATSSASPRSRPTLSPAGATGSPDATRAEVSATTSARSTREHRHRFPDHASRSAVILSASCSKPPPMATSHQHRLVAYHGFPEGFRLGVTLLRPPTHPIGPVQLCSPFRHT